MVRRLAASAASTMVVAIVGGSIVFLTLTLAEPALGRVTGICAGLAAAYLVPRSFPLWRQDLSDRDRAKLASGSFVGGLLGLALGTLGGFLALSPNLSAPVQSNGSMAIAIISILAGSLFGSYRATSEIPFLSGDPQAGSIRGGIPTGRI